MGLEIVTCEFVRKQQLTITEKIESDIITHAKRRQYQQYACA